MVNDSKSMSFAKQSYSERASRHPSAVARTLLQICERKRTNLCVSADLTTKKDLLRVVEAVAPFVCLIKTHIDIVEDFDRDLIDQLIRLSKEHDFLFFEDRKFADIGNTVKLQYTAGVYRIASWAHIVNAHAIPGDGIITGLQSGAADVPDRGLLMLAEMSSKGSLATSNYTQATVEMARRHRDFVMGFIAQSRVHETDGKEAAADDFLILSPGVGLDSRGDGMGQQYRTPAEVIGVSGCDICIVGRGIYGGGSGRSTAEIQAEARRYQEAGWSAYQARLQP